MFISSAFAQAATDAAATAGAAPSPLANMMPLLLIFVVFYFLLIRPQQKKFKAHQAMINDVKTGDQVVTAGGVYGRVTRVEADNELMVQIASGVEVKVARNTLATVLNSDGTPKLVEPAKKKAA